MDVRFLGKNLKVTKPIKEHLYDRMSKLDKYAPKIVETHVVLKKEKYLYHATITLVGKNLRAFGEGTQKENIYAAIDQAAERVQKQLKKFRDKIKDHHKEHGPNAVSPKVKTASRFLAEEAAVGQFKPAVIKTPLKGLKTMNVEEASLKLEIDDIPFLLFLNAETKGPSVIYKRDDGNHGLMDPEF
ncbi:MAG TPA: ribosome-associated translation inhibitor RaiA [Verrucomicrobiae bacterium]|jgi:putative sigma-54 modulation protein|nr:ribosome-associated translation inhibitor RaiA [Verrucomicrobiae bacterium]